MEGNKVIKVTTAPQFSKLVELMKEKPYLAKGFLKGCQKINIKEEWNTISEDFNCIGPVGAVSLLDMHSIIEHKNPFGLQRPRVVSPDPVPNKTLNESLEKILPNKTSNESLEEIDQPCTSSAAVHMRKNIKKKEKVTLLEQQVEIQKELCLEIKNKLSEIESYNRKMFKIKEEKLSLCKNELKNKDDHRKALLEIRKSELEIKAKNLDLEELRINKYLMLVRFI